MLKPEEQQARIQHLIGALRRRQERIGCVLSAEELEEIGYLTLLMGVLEESVAMFCEYLLVRPEPGEVLSSKESVIRKQLKAKLKLLGELIRACGTYNIDIRSLEQSIAEVAEIGEYRNAVIHGQLARNAGGSISFQIRGHEVPLEMGGLRNLTGRCYSGIVVLETNLQIFHTELARTKSVNPEVEETLQAFLKSDLAYFQSYHVVREDTVKLKASKEKLFDSFQNMEEPRAALAEVKRQLAEAEAKKTTS
jgi:hypothetical protein